MLGDHHINTRSLPRKPQSLAFLKGRYNDIVDQNLDIRDGYLHAPQRPGIGTRLKAGVRERSDATTRVSNEPRKSLIDEWGPHTRKPSHGRLLGEGAWAAVVRDRDWYRIILLPTALLCPVIHRVSCFESSSTGQPFRYQT